MSDRQLLGLYPQDIGASTVILDRKMKPSGAIVLGMGPLGELTQSRLAMAVTDAVLQYALRVQDEVDWKKIDGRRSAAFSTVLLGTSGRHGVSMIDSVKAIIRGTVEAEAILQERRFGDRVRIDKIQIFERYSETADEAVRVLREIDKQWESEFGGAVVIETNPRLRMSKGGLLGQPGNQYETGSWARLVIRCQEGTKEATHPKLEFLSLGRRSAADTYEEEVNACNLTALIERVIASDSVNQTHNTLFELLIPGDFKSELRDGGNRVLVVDEVSASYPWETLAVKDRDGRCQPLVQRSGILRQLIQKDVEARVLNPLGSNALVIGDPSGGPGFPRLNAARLEAERVSETLKSHGFTVKELVARDDDSPPWMDIMNALFEKEYRIVHVAAHGVFDPDSPTKSGIVIGPGKILTASDVRKLPVIPELVFLNCCNLGKTTGTIIPSEVRDRQKLASSIAVTLMQIGVRAVVAAGWEVEDEAARRFATTLYSKLFDGFAYGSAVDLARKAAASVSNESNSWGAYQCYGDPGFRLVSDRCSSREHHKQNRPVSRHELLRRLKQVAIHAKEPTSSHEELERELKELQWGTPVEWQDGEVNYQFGLGFSELCFFGEPLRFFEEAIRYLTSAMEKWQAGSPLALLERLANLQVRLATQVAPRDQKSRERDVLMKDADRLLTKRAKVPPATAELYALIGSYHKKRATTLRQERARISAVRASAKAYQNARMLTEDSHYGVINWIVMTQLESLTAKGKKGTLSDDRLEILKDVLETCNSDYLAMPTDAEFWDRVALPDVLLANALVHDKLVEDAPEITRLYQHAFRMRSSRRERSSVIEHCEDLRHLVADEDMQNALKRIVDDLREPVAQG